VRRISLRQFSASNLTTSAPLLDADNSEHWCNENRPHMRMSIYPDHVLDRLQDEQDQLTAPGYI
jgi:hypothetical protein